jgi:hypothetical protein
MVKNILCGGALVYLRVPLQVVERDGKDTGGWGYNWATFSLGHINKRT